MRVESHQALPYADLTAAQFEELAFLLGHAQIPELIKTSNPDGGLDAILPDPERASRGLEARRHTKGINWKECRGSLAAAVSTPTPVAASHDRAVVQRAGRDHGIAFFGRPGR